ncbi:MAG: D-glycero-alpha-D-manno-heptose-1,7-bisphosphate 7-phosphatase [Phormidesmis sp.]
MTPALFLDRDGVINRETHYLHRIEDFEFIPGTFVTCRAFQAAGYRIIVITNQGGIGRGYYTEADFHQLNAWMLKQFETEGIHITQTYFSPYHPTHGIGKYRRDHPDRKPNPGMILKAQQDWQIDLTTSVLVGDKESDVQAGLNAGLRQNILVRSGHIIDEANSQAIAIANSIADIPKLVLSQTSSI